MSRRQISAQAGATMVEMLLALPVVLLLGLGIAQFTLVYQAKHALDYALTQAARQGAVEHASAASIERGLAVGLVPYLYGAGDWAGLLQAEERAAEHVRGGLAQGWILLRQRSPSRESFDDWAEPALDAMGEPIPGLVEIANDNLDSRRLWMQPASGVVGMSRSEAVGRASGQTLADANMLRLELVYGVRLAVPVVGAMVIHALARWNACPQARETSPRQARLGLLRLGEVAPQAAAQAWMCSFLAARDDSGAVVGRIPVRASATVRMMSPSRQSTLTQARIDRASGLASRAERVGEPSPEDGPSGTGGGSGGGEPVPPGETRMPPRVSPRPPLQSTPRSTLDNGFLAIGSDRAYPRPSVHPALCDG